MFIYLVSVFFCLSLSVFLTSVFHNLQLNRPISQIYVFHRRNRAVCSCLHILRCVIWREHELENGYGRVRILPCVSIRCSLMAVWVEFRSYLPMANKSGNGMDVCVPTEEQVQLCYVTYALPSSLKHIQNRDRKLKK